MEEMIKWNSFIFMYKGNMVFFFMNVKKYVSLMFYKGVYLFNLIGLLEGEGKEG